MIVHAKRVLPYTEMRYQILTDELIGQIDDLSAADQAKWIILTPSEEFPEYWDVDGLGEEFFYDLADIVGRYSIISPARLEFFLEQATSQGYEVAFAADPQPSLDQYEALREDPPISLNSTLEDVRNGFLPWQIVGFNKLVRSELPAAMAIWDTGSGKCALAAAAIKYYQGRFDLALMVVKAHNKTDTQRKFKRLADLDAMILDAVKPTKRFELYEQVHEDLKAGKEVIAIMNYEKFREDRGIFGPLLNKRRCLICWDEMPAKLGNRRTQLYDSTKKALFKSFVSKPHPSWARHIMLSATPVERDPENVYNCLNLILPRYLGTVTEFEAEYVASRNHFSDRPEAWRNLDKLEAKIDHLTHRVSKDDPAVAALFPHVIPDPRIIDWNPKHRRIYDRLTGKAKDMLEEFEDMNVLSLIQIMQMLCDAPSMVRESARNRAMFDALLEQAGDLDPEDIPLSGPTGSAVAQRLLEVLEPDSLTDEGHAKLEVWREIILEKHPDAKIITHSTWAGYIFPVWESWLQEWGVSYVTYTGTDKQKQDALDAFRDDPSIRVFLSGDSGSDSIDIPQASVGINYNGPWKWTTEKQREGRRDRVDSTFDTIYTYTLSMANSVEDRKREIRERKRQYHAALFEGRAVESALSARLSGDELRYMLFGEET